MRSLCGLLRVSVFMMVYLNCRELGVESVSTNEHIEFCPSTGWTAPKGSCAQAWG